MRTQEIKRTVKLNTVDGDVILVSVELQPCFAHADTRVV